MENLFNKEIFLNNCKELCRKEGINQKEFNTRIDYRDAITKWQNKKRPVTPSMEVINRIATEFSCDICWLITGRNTVTEPEIIGKTDEEETEGMNATLLKTIEQMNRAMAILNSRIEHYERGLNREPKDKEPVKLPNLIEK